MPKSQLSRRNFALWTTGAMAGSLPIATRAFGQKEVEPKKLSADAAGRGPRESAFQRDYPEPGFKPSWKKEQVNRQLAADYVIYAHSDLEMTRKLLDREPGLLNAAVDWGGGDWETALGGASHMGRRDIVEMLLQRGARSDIFCAAMLGQLNVVQALITMQPKLIDAKGPHGFSLHFHAQVGGEESKPVLDYLQSVKEVTLRPIPFLQKKKK